MRASCRSAGTLEGVMGLHFARAALGIRVHRARVLAALELFDPLATTQAGTTPQYRLAGLPVDASGADVLQALAAMRWTGLTVAGSS